MAKIIKFTLIWLFIPCITFAYSFNPKPLLDQARTYLESGNFAQAIESYDLVYTYARDVEVKAKALVRMADISALFLDQKEVAKDYYQKAIKLFPYSRELKNAYFNLAMLLYEQGSLQDSLHYFQEFIHNFPQDIRYSTAEYMIERIKREIRKGEKPSFKIEPPSLGDEPIIRVLLAKVKNVNLTSKQNLWINGSSYPKGVYVFKIKNGTIYLGQKRLNRVVDLKFVDVFIFNNKKYKGRLKLKLKDNLILVINCLPMEEYLKGVVPKEMSASWPLEALKAQAVAARSYAYFVHLKSEEKDFDLSSSVASQVYGGISPQSSKSIQAVWDTRGEILMFKGKPVIAYFHSHSGGVLETAKNVWKVQFPYFRIKRDPYSNKIKKLEWRTEISLSKIENVLREKGFGLSRIKRVESKDVSPSGRVINFSITAENGEVLLASNNMRIWLGPSIIKSTLCSVKQVGTNLLFKGRGYGHGVGMSQWGAYDMAKEGKKYREILQFYYPGTTIKTIY